MQETWVQSLGWGDNRSTRWGRQDGCDPVTHLDRPVTSPGPETNSVFAFWMNSFQLFCFLFLIMLDDYDYNGCSNLITQWSSLLTLWYYQFSPHSWSIVGIFPLIKGYVCYSLHFCYISDALINITCKQGSVYILKLEVEILGKSLCF